MDPLDMTLVKKQEQDDDDGDVTETEPETVSYTYEEDDTQQAYRTVAHLAQAHQQLARTPQGNYHLVIQGGKVKMVQQQQLEQVEQAQPQEVPQDLSLPSKPVVEEPKPVEPVYQPQVQLSPQPGPSNEVHFRPIQLSDGSITYVSPEGDLYQAVQISEAEVPSVEQQREFQLESNNKTETIVIKLDDSASKVSAVEDNGTDIVPLVASPPPVHNVEQQKKFREIVTASGVVITTSLDVEELTEAQKRAKEKSKLEKQLAEQQREARRKAKEAKQKAEDERREERRLKKEAKEREKVAKKPTKVLPVRSTRLPRRCNKEPSPEKKPIVVLNEEDPPKKNKRRRAKSVLYDGKVLVQVAGPPANMVVQPKEADPVSNIEA